MGLSFGHLLVLLLVVLLLFGKRLPSVMGDIGKGIRNMRDELGGEKGKQEVLPPEDKDKA